MNQIKFIYDGSGWYHIDTDFLRYTIKRAGRQTWFIYESRLGSNFGTHIATSSRIHDAKAWLRNRIESEMLMK